MYLNRCVSVMVKVFKRLYMVKMELISCFQSNLYEKLGIICINKYKKCTATCVILYYKYYMLNKQTDLIKHNLQT